MAVPTNIDQLAGVLLRSFRGAQQAANLSGQMQSTYGTIKDVNDPKNLGRVKVVLDQVNPEYLQGKGFEQQGQETQTDWIYPIVPIKGRQAPGLVGARVPITPRDGDPNRLNFGDPIYDPNEFSKAKQPKNSAQTRLPVYPSGNLPPASSDNIGCMLVEQGGPQGLDWLCVCLNRSGGYKWVRMADRLHYHTGQLPDTDNDSEGNGPDTSTEQRTYDDIIVTTGNPLEGSD
jgi:hypothetical protein